MNYPAAELRGIKGVQTAILYWKGTCRFPFQTNPFLVFHPAAELRGILLIKPDLRNNRSYNPSMYFYGMFSRKAYLRSCT